MTAIPFPLSSSPGQDGQEGAGRLINCFAEPRGENAGPVWRRAPGASVFGEETSSDWDYWTPAVWPMGEGEDPSALDGIFRGGIIVGGAIYAVFGEKAYNIDSNGNHIELGTIPGDDLVFFARNNDEPSPDKVIVCEAGVYRIAGSGSGTVVQFDSLGSPNSVCFHDGYLMFGYGDGTVQATQINDLDFNALDFTRAESNPDGVLHPFSYQGQLYVMGELTIEVFGRPINSTAFPLSRIGYHITPGLLAPHAVAGFQPEFGHPPLWVASDCTVRMLNGYTAEKVSPPDLDRLIAAETDRSDINALCYVVGGHAFWQVNIGDTASWVYALNNGTWHERQSYLLTRSRLRGSLFAFDQWLVGDTEAAQFLSMSHTVHKEGDDPLVFHAESGPVESFPNRSRVARADFDFAMGVGIATGDDPMQTDPTVRVSFSNDGINWSTPYNRKLGRQNVTDKRIIIPPSGMTGTQGRRWRVQISDEVHVGLKGGSMEPPLGDK